MIYLYLFGTCFHFIYVFMIIDINMEPEDMFEITSYSDGLLVLHNQYNIEF